ncbi:MAG: aminomethyltransferase family protein [Leclercia sp.]
MTSLSDIHLKNQATMGVYNNRTLPSAYHSPSEEYKAVRENVLLVDYSHMSIVSVMGEDAWALVNYMASADVSIIRDEQGIYSLVLNDDGTVRGDIYALCTPEGYYILSENLSASDITGILQGILEKADELDIQDIPDITAMDDADWGTIMLEGPYAWELMAEIYGFDVIGLPYYEYMNTDDGLMVFRCGKHGEFAYQMIGPQRALAELWLSLLDIGDKYLLKTGGLDYQQRVRIENPGWDESLYAKYTRNPVELQLQWAIQYDKDDFTGKAAVEQLSAQNAQRKVVGMLPSTEGAGLSPDDKVRVNNREVGVIIHAVYSPALQREIALALIDSDYALSDIDGFTVHTAQGEVAARTQSVPFIYNLSLSVNPTAHSYVDASKARRTL